MYIYHNIFITTRICIWYICMYLHVALRGIASASPSPSIGDEVVSKGKLAGNALALADLNDASMPSDVDFAGYLIHPLRDNLKGMWSISISGNWRVTFRFEDGEIHDVDLVDCHQLEDMIMAMKSPPHPGRSIKHNCLRPLGQSVTECARVLGVARLTLSRVLNGHAAISTEIAIRLEKPGWSNADFWLRRQTAYDLDKHAEARTE